MAKKKSGSVAVPAEPESGVSQTRPAEKAPEVVVEVRVSLATAVPEILRLDSQGQVLVWDAASFPHLEEETLRKLSHENRKRYFMAQARSKEERVRRQMAEAGKRAGRLEVYDPLEFQTHATRRVRARPGWHWTWIRGDQFEAKVVNGPYIQVRKPHKDYPDEKPGEETGEVLKVSEGMVGNRQIDLIAVECPEDLYQLHIRNMAYKSHRKYAHDQRAAMEAFVDKKNTEIGAPREVLRVVDMSTEDREVRRVRGGPEPADPFDEEK